MSLRDGVLPSKQSRVICRDCFAKCARNDMQTASLRELQSATREGGVASSTDIAAIHAATAGRGV